MPTHTHSATPAVTERERAQHTLLQPKTPPPVLKMSVCPGLCQIQLLYMMEGRLSLSLYSIPVQQPRPCCMLARSTYTHRLTHTRLLPRLLLPAANWPNSLPWIMCRLCLPRSSCRKPSCWWDLAVTLLCIKHAAGRADAVKTAAANNRKGLLVCDTHVTAPDDGAATTLLYTHDDMPQNSRHTHTHTSPIHTCTLKHTYWVLHTPIGERHTGGRGPCDATHALL